MNKDQREVQRKLRALREAEEFKTSTPGAKLLLHITGAIAEFDHHLVRERTQSGLKATRCNMRIGGVSHQHKPRDVPIVRATCPNTAIKTPQVP